MSQPLEIEQVRCPVPLRDYSQIVLAHGGGGKLSADLVEHLFLPAFRNATLESLGDSAVLDHCPGRMAFSTDSHVVRPLFFPGGCIGDLAVNGTVNDLAMSGARPLYLSVGFIIEEGFAMDQLCRIVDAMARAAAAADVQIVTGDTKVVDRGHGDGCYLNTAGVGELASGVDLAPSNIRVGDAIISSGTIGDHGMAIMSVREGLQFESAIKSDTAPLGSLVQSMLDTGATIRALRDPTRGGVATSLNELASAAHVGMIIEESKLPIDSTTQSACDLLGLDPMFVANEGKLLAFVAADQTDLLLKAMRAHPLGKAATVVGHVTDEHPGMVIALTAVGGKRVIAMQVGEPLPRIC
jgi:hydrogenase expression/formation protein HypE